MCCHGRNNNDSKKYQVKNYTKNNMWYQTLLFYYLH